RSPTGRRTEMKIEPAALAQYIDHTLLAADATREQIATLCREAQEHGFYSVCVNSGQVPYAASLLTEGRVKQAIAAGAGEIDMVLNVGALKDGLLDQVSDDIAAVKQACGAVPLKVILETCLLDDAQKTKACEICRELDVAFVKTSTGFSRSGATLEDV
nr:hypothetical protein [Tanacetum cinerariifolium]